MEVKQRTFADYNKEVEATPTTETTTVPQNIQQVNTVDTGVPATTIANVEPPATNVPEAAATTAPTNPVIEETTDDVVAFEMPDYSAPQEAVQPQAIASWKDALKDEKERAEVLKELGLDPFVVELNEHIKRGGKASDYLNARAVDWNTVSDEEIVKTELAKEFPEATKTQIDRLFNKRYSQTELAEDEDKEDGLLLMKKDARVARGQRSAEQAKFKLPEPTQQQSQPQANPEVEAAIQQRQQFFDKVINSEATKNLFQSKRVAIDLGEGVKPVNVSIPNPAALMDVLFKPEIASKLGRTPQGEPDVQFWQELALFMSNPKQYKQVIRNSSKELAKQDLVSEGQNASRPTPVIPMGASQYSNVGDAFNSGNIKVGKLGRYDR